MVTRLLQLCSFSYAFFNSSLLTSSPSSIQDVCSILLFMEPVQSLVRGTCIHSRTTAFVALWPLVYLLSVCLPVFIVGVAQLTTFKTREQLLVERNCDFARNSLLHFTIELWYFLNFHRHCVVDLSIPYIFLTTSFLDFRCQHPVCKPYQNPSLYPCVLYYRQHTVTLGWTLVCYLACSLHKLERHCQSLHFQ